MQLSKKQEKVYSLLREKGLQVFTIQDIVLLLGISRTSAYNLIKVLKKKNIIEVLSSGTYAFWDSNEFLVGAHFNIPSYVSFLSALNYYGFSDNAPRKIIFVSTRYKKSNKFEYVCVAKKRFFGYKKFGEIIIGDKEKVFVDSLLFPKYSGGIKEVSKTLKENFKSLDLKKLVDSAFKVESKMVLRRLGFILEGKLDKKSEKRLLRNIGKGVGFLDPNIKITKNLNKKWLLYTSLR